MHLALLFYIGDAGQVLEGSVGGRAELGRDAHHDEEREAGQHRIVGGGHLDACALGVEEDGGEDVREDGEGQDVQHAHRDGEGGGAGRRLHDP
eukprot:scaffold120310_cov63-Phaeocystis_antarctica.AAC.4